MIEIKDGDIFSSKANVIFHQVNCQGKMNLGIAKKVRKICPQHYKDYMRMYIRYGSNNLLGRWVCTRYNESIIICGIFGQKYYGHNDKYTNYDAIRQALYYHKYQALLNRNINTFAMPYKMGCNLGGGDWDKVMEIITELFSDDGIVMEIWKK